VSHNRIVKVLSALALLLPLGVALAQPAYSEAPALAERAASGELPPVAERLPQNPLVVEPVERVGEYGGAWRTALLGGSDHVWLTRTLAYENLVRWNPEWTEVIPNVAESFEVNEDATQYTFKLREGLKWSDGAPFTADDIMFWYEDVLLNEELTPSVPEWLVSGGEPVVVEKVDDATVRFTFTQPYGLFLQELAGVSGSLPTQYPRHYLGQFHPKHNPDVDALVQEAGMDTWTTLFANRGGAPIEDVAYWQTTEIPTLHAWMLTTPYDAASSRVVAERNPYYFKVDPEGNQLPYLDRVVYEQVADEEVLLLKALNGEIDMMDRHVGSLQNRAVLFDNMERGDYRFYDVVHDSMNSGVFALNLTHQDPVKREVFQNKDFRIGLSHAINRQEIIDLLFVSQGEPWQTSPKPESPFYHERLAKQYTEYDVALANEHLDRVLPEKDAQGFRLLPNGERLTIVTELSDLFGNSWPQTAELLQGYWREVGVDMQVRAVDRSLLYTRKEANEHDLVVWGCGGGLDVLLTTNCYFPSSAEANFAIPWANWYTGGPNAEEPPEAAKRQMELYDQLKTTADLDQQAALMQEILDIAAEEFYLIGTRLNVGNYGIVKNSFRNVPKSMPGSGGTYNHPAPTNPSQYFIDSSL